MISLVTGATGFIGTNLVRRLMGDGNEVRVLSRRPVQIHGATAHLVDFDQPTLGLDDSVFAGVDVLYHLAGATRAASPEAFFRANAITTRLLIDRIGSIAARPRFLYVSSQAAAGPAQHGALSESDAPHPLEQYGQSKLAGEQIVAAHAGDLPWTIVRPSAVYGPGDHDFLPIFSMAKRGVAIYPGTKDAMLTTIFVEDLVSALIAAAQSSVAAGKTYFLGSDAHTTWSDIYHTVADVMSSRFRLEVNIPIPLMQLGGLAGDLFGRLSGRIPLLNSDKVALAKPRSWICSSELAHADFGFTAPTALRDGLAATHSWYVKQGWL